MVEYTLIKARYAEFGFRVPMEAVMIKGIVFDKDGTLMEYEEFWVPVSENAIKLLLKSENLAESHEKEILDEVGASEGISGTLCYGTYGQITDVFNEVLKRKNPDFKGFSVDDVMDSFKECTKFGKIVPTCKNIQEVFKKLKETGLKIALITSDNETMTKICLEELGILEYFDVLFTDDGINPSKPDPYYMNKFCAQFGFEPNEVVMVGDTNTDMDFAKNSGAIGVGVAKKDEYREKLLPYAYKVVNDVSDLFEVIESISYEI